MKKVTQRCEVGQAYRLVNNPNIIYHITKTQGGHMNITTFYNIVPTLIEMIPHSLFDKADLLLKVDKCE